METRVQISPNCDDELLAFRVQSRPRDQLTLNRTTAYKPLGVAPRIYLRTLHGLLTKRNNVAQEREREKKETWQKKRGRPGKKDSRGQKGLCWPLGKLIFSEDEIGLFSLEVFVYSVRWMWRPAADLVCSSITSPLCVFILTQVLGI